MRNQQEELSRPTPEECCTLRQHFNYLRNNSNTMRNILSWNQPEQSNQDYNQQGRSYNPMQNISKIEEDQHNRQKRNVSFDINQNITNSATRPQIINAPQANKKAINTQEKGVNNQERIKSSHSANKRGNQDDQDAQIRKRIREKELEQQAAKKEESRQKVKQYIQDLKPYTRSLTNSKYQDYFDKAALQSYGRANLKNAIGGIIYGNHQKTFNVNPHTKGNEPKYYQTHQTAINYCKRTKLNEQGKWSRLEKQLTKKLGLKDKNQSLKAGKQVVEVDVDDDNMYSVMKENLEFKKRHNEEIRDLEKDYKAQIQSQKQAAVAEFYAQKQERILSGNTIDSQLSTYVNPRDQKGRLQEQVVFKHTDKNGLVRYGADRHALTCFVDMNFPENDAVYTQELINRSPIYPVDVEEKDKFLDQRRRANYIKSQSNIYPSHYLLPNSDQPEVIKMINSQYSEVSPSNPQQTKSPKDMVSTRGTLGLSNKSH